MVNPHTEDWIDAGIIPCTVCPYHMTGKLRVELREESNASAGYANSRNIVSIKNFNKWKKLKADILENCFG